MYVAEKMQYIQGSGAWFQAPVRGLGMCSQRWRGTAVGVFTTAACVCSPSRTHVHLPFCPLFNPLPSNLIVSFSIHFHFIFYKFPPYQKIRQYFALSLTILLSITPSGIHPKELSQMARLCWFPGTECSLCLSCLPHLLYPNNPLMVLILWMLGCQHNTAVEYGTWIFLIKVFSPS